MGLGEADIDGLEDTLEIVVDRVSAKEDFPGVTVDTDEREHYVIGDGATTIKGGRDAVIGWLARGLTDGLRYDDGLPERPSAVLSAELDRPAVPTTATNSGVRDVHPTRLRARRSARR